MTITDDDAPGGSGDLIAYWKFDESSGSTVYDNTAYNNDGTITNDVTFVNGKINNAIDVAATGDHDYITVSNSASLQIDDDLSIAFWIKAPADQPGSSKQVLATKDYYSSEDAITIDTSSDNSSALRMNLFTSAANNQNTNIDGVMDDTWHHVVFTASDGTFTKYLDGSAVTTGSMTYNHGNGFGNTNDWGIGAANGDMDFDGKLDELRVYNKVLSAAEVTDLYGVESSDKVVHLEMDETSGTTAYDDTSHANDATLTNATFVAGKGGNAIDFDGNGDWATIAGGGSMNIDDDITIAFWINASADQPNDMRQILSTRDYNGSGDGFSIDTNYDGTDSIRLNIFTSAGGNQDTVLTGVMDNTWHHVAFTINSGTVTVYRDGVSVGTDTYNHGNGFGNNNDWILGATDAGGSTGLEFDGLLDDFNTYSKVLSSQEIDDLYDVLAI